MNESASCCLDSDIGFMRCRGMRTLAHECLGVPWHAVHDGYLGNAPSARLQVYGFLDQQCQPYWPKTSVRETRFSRNDNQTECDIRSKWFQQEVFPALMPKPACRVWSGISLPNSFPLIGGLTPVPPGNGGEENCISVSAIAPVECSP
jgi:hypothetical protein